jgi:succinyl-diaminopimelate desuccinylase
MAPDPSAGLLALAEARADELLQLAQDLLAAPSENPPGDTTAAAAVVTAYIERQRLAYRTIAPQASMPNLVATVEGGRPGPHLVFNGHLDTFPAGDLSRWDSPPFQPEIRDGKLFGRGAADMKGGLASLVVAFATLAAHRERLAGRLTLTVVSDEETFGPWGARYLLERHADDVLGDALLSAEPSSPWLVRCGEKGMLWLRVRTRGAGAHGGLPHRSRNAIRELLGILTELASLEGPVEPPSDAVRQVIEGARVATDRAFGDGTTDVLGRVTLNLGTIQGGLKVNVVAPEATAEVDLRLPIGVAPEAMQARVAEIVDRYGADLEYLTVTAPSFSAPGHAIFATLRDAAEMVTGSRPLMNVSAPGTDSRLWRQRGVPAAVYGPKANNVGSANEHIFVSDLLAVNRVHILAAYRFLDGA